VPTTERPGFCAKCKSWSYAIRRNARGNLICARCEKRRAIRRQPGAVPEVEAEVCGMNPAWEEDE